MANIFVFGIGGTGARVLRSLTMLLASGVKLNRNDRIVPIIIDLDLQNGDTARAIKAMDMYKFIRDRAYGERAEVEEGFFSTEFCKLNSLRSAENQENVAVTESFQLKFQGIDDRFKDYLNYNEMDQIDQHFLQALYDDSPQGSPGAELELSLNVGFKGNPNIGSVVFNDLVNTNEYKYFNNIFQDQDRIFIVSSIFGGTGSSGFPQLVKLIRNSENDRLKDAKIGAISVMPYFNVEEDESSAISSKRFISKTKAALSYYQEAMNHQNGRNGLDVLYYIYDNPGSSPYVNIEGGTKQINNAHVVEMLAASSLVHFANLSNEIFGTSTKYYEYGIKEAATALSIKHFYDYTKELFLKPLTYLTYFAKLHLEFIPNADKAGFLDDFIDKYAKDDFFNTLSSFFTNHYLLWLYEMKNNERSFQPFGFDENGNLNSFNDLVTENPIETSFFNKGLTDKFFNTVYGKIIDKMDRNESNVYRKYLNATFKVCKTAFEEKLGALPNLV